MKKKDVFNYGMECFESIIDGPAGNKDCQIEDWYDNIQSTAAALKSSKDFNFHEDFMEAIRKKLY